jgi:N-methylhydantoinase B/oxoprolinase/acetone carboxylase alpha subunit
MGAGCTRSLADPNKPWLTMLTKLQVLEFRYPVVLEEFSVRRGSGGDGRHRGGAGVLRRIRFNEAMEVREREDLT